MTESSRIPTLFGAFFQMARYGGCESPDQETVMAVATHVAEYGLEDVIGILKATDS